MPFKKGQSGNPAGRKPSLNTMREFREKLSDDMPDILETVVKMAKDGDMAACKLLMDRLYPAIKPQAMPISVPIAETLDATGNNILATILNGTVSPDIGAALITALANQAKIIEISDLQKRIEALEGKP
jgi:hypothetical protein